EGVIGLALNAAVLVLLWNRTIRTGWSTYRIGMSITALLAATLSLLSGISCMVHIFRFEYYAFIFYGPIVYLPRIFCDMSLFVLFTLCLGIWQFTPASSFLQYLALCKPHISEFKRVIISYSLSIILMLTAMPFYTTFHAPVSQRPVFEQIARSVHDLAPENAFYAYGATLFGSKQYPKACIDLAIFSVAPSYSIAYVVFIWCCVRIYRALTSFGVQLSAKTLAMQRSFLTMLLLQLMTANMLQGLVPLLLMGGPVGGFITALITGIAMDKWTLFISFSLFGVSIVQ
ncbi:hypothetical protein PMAYCL1PPCAC_15046, partial [Pristionchus mayeri]